MRRNIVIALGVLLASSVVTLLVVGAQSGTAAKPPDHGIFPPVSITWADAPAALPQGAKLAVLEGDPSKEGLYTMRLKMPTGYKIPPHWHPVVEHITVISGRFNVGMGDKFDKTKGNALPTGSFAFLAAKMNHFAWADRDTVIQLHGSGPWQINYVNPADDPRGAHK